MISYRGEDIDASPHLEGEPLFLRLRFQRTNRREAHHARRERQIDEAEILLNAVRLGERQTFNAHG